MPNSIDKLKNNPKWYSSRNWFSFVLKGLGYQFPGMIFSVITMGLATAGLAYLYVNHNHFIPDNFPNIFHTVLGIVIGLLLVFRTNTAYDHWWEGRKQLGALVNTSRTLAIKFEAYLHKEKYEGKREIKQLIVAFAWAMKEHLRMHDYSKYKHYIPKRLQKGFLATEQKPNFIILELSKHVQILLKKGVISGSHLVVLEQEISILVNALGACERIRNTPIPKGYAIHLKRILLIYVVTLPVTFLSMLQYWAVPVAMIVFYTMVGIELVGEEIEDPFGTDPNDLPMDALAKKIETDVNEIIIIAEEVPQSELVES